MSELIYDKYGNPVDTVNSGGDGVQGANNSLATAGLNYGFNGLTWDRIRTMGNMMDGMMGTSAGLLQVMNSPMGYNGSTFDRLRSGPNNTDAMGAQATGVQHVNAFNMGYNGATWDRLRSGGNNADGIATSSAGIQSHNAFNLIYNGSTYDRQLSAYNMMNGMSGKGMAANTNMAYNGTTYDNVYNNSQGTLLASGARTSNVATPLQTNYNARGVIIFLNVTAASGTGGLTTHIGIQDPVSGTQAWYNVSPTAVTAVGLTTYVLYPSISGTAATQVTNGVLPRSWYVQINTGDATSYTYSVGYALIL